MATESIQPYTTARVDYLASYLQTLLPGLDKTVATKWISAERGVSGNVLGTTYNTSSGQHLYTYASQEAGLRAAAGWINSNQRYSGVKSSLGSSASAQASALATSGWNNSYYPGVFASVIGGHSSTPSGGASTPLTSMPSQTNPGGSTTTTLDKMLGLPASTIVNADTIPMLTAKVASLLQAGTITNAQSQSLLTTIGSMGVSHSNPTLGSRTIDSATGQANLGITAPTIQDAVTFVGIILVGVAFLGLGGLIALRKK
jgi:hypothetical protein